jgi:DUF4097 and DUF4098 domain-containing protein YvlB
VVSKRFVISLVTILFLSAVAFGGKVYHYEYQKIIPVEPGLEISIDNPNGTVTIMTNTEDRLKIDAVKNIYAESQEEAEFVADHVQVEINDADGHFTIEPRFLKIQHRSPSFWQKLLGQGNEESSRGSVDFVISVPADCNVDLYNPLGNIEVKGLRGRVEVSGDAGDVEVAEIIGNVNIVTSSGAVAVKNIEGEVYIRANGSDLNFFSISGDLEIRNSAGDVAGEYLIGDLSLTLQDGRIDLDFIEGDIRIKTTSAAVIIDQDFGSLDVSTESGDIDIATELNSSRDYFVETVSGSIRFMVPEASGGEVRLEAGSCEIDTQIPIAIESFSRTRISGSFGNGGPKIVLVTATGDITLGEY